MISQTSVDFRIIHIHMVAGHMHTPLGVVGVVVVVVVVVVVLLSTLSLPT